MAPEPKPKSEEIGYWMGQVDGRLAEMQSAVKTLSERFQQLVLTREGWRTSIESRLNADGIRFEEHSQRIQTLEQGLKDSERRLEEKLNSLQQSILDKISESGERRPTWQWLIEKIGMPIGVGLISAIITAAVLLSVFEQTP